MCSVQQDICGCVHRGKQPQIFHSFVVVFSTVHTAVETVFVETLELEPYELEP